MEEPEYLICLNCESPCYLFEFEVGKVVEVLCPVCGNDRPEEFLSPQELDELSGA